MEVKTTRDRVVNYLSQFNTAKVLPPRTIFCGKTFAVTQGIKRYVLCGKTDCFGGRLPAIVA
jgi:hypothetical protein